MNLSLYVDSLRQHLAVAADAGGDDARALAERLTAPLEPAARLILLEVLSAAADEITSELAPGTVELRLRGGDPVFVVTPAPTDAMYGDAGAGPSGPGDTVSATGASQWAETAAPDADEGGTSRLNLRLSDALKLRIEESARREGLSLNAWLVRAATAALDTDVQDRRAEPRNPRGGQRYTGWVR